MSKEDREITIHIAEYGDITVMRPKKLNKATFLDAIADTVGKVLTLTSPQVQGERFHPALGKGGHVERRADQETAS